MIIWTSGIADWTCLTRDGQHEAERGDHERHDEQQHEDLEHHQRVVGHADEAREREHDHRLERRDRGAAEAFAGEDGGRRDRRHQHLAQEAELAVPHHRDAGKRGGEQHRHGEDAGEQEGLEVDPAGRSLDQRPEAAAEDEKEQQRLDHRGDDARRIAPEADHLALPHDERRTDLVADPPLGTRGPLQWLPVLMVYLPRRALMGLNSALALCIADRRAGVSEKDVVEARAR